MNPANWESWTLMRLAVEVVSTRDKFIPWAQTNGLIKEECLCDEGHQMKLDGGQLKNALGSWRCRKRHADGKDRKFSVQKGTWFDHVHILPEKALALSFMFAEDFSFSRACREIEFFGLGTSNSTVSDWFSYCRELVSDYMESLQNEEGLIGGLGTVVEIDETKFGKRKNFVGRIKEGVWIFGMIERGSKRFRLERCPDNKRDAATLLPLIQKHVLPGTTIMSDSWSAYNQIGSSGYFHFKVNHSQNFVDPNTGAHTQTIESSWRHLKRNINIFL